MKKLGNLILTGILAAVLLNLCACKKQIKNKPECATGLIFDKERYNNVPRKAQLLTRSYENIPSSVMLTDFTPPVAYQGDFGTCAAWASAYAAMTTAEAVVQKNTDKSLLKQNAFSPFYLYRSCNPDQVKTATGMKLEDALDWLKVYGVPRRSQNEINSSYSTFDMDKYNEADLFTIANYCSLGSAEDFSSLTEDSYRKITRNIKKSISEKKPVIIAFGATQEFCELYFKKEYFPKAVEADLKNQDSMSGHAMVIVGYDDNYHIDESEEGSFLIQNSWSTWWGKDGYIWIGYDVAYVYMFGAYEISNKITRIPYYQEVVNVEEDEPEVEILDDKKNSSFDFFNWLYGDDEEDDDWWWNSENYDGWWSNSDYSHNDPKKEHKKEPKKVPVIPEPEPVPAPKPKPAPQPEKQYCIFEGEFSIPLYKEDGEIEVHLNNNFYETYKSYESLTQFQLYMTNKKPCYVYAFAADDSFEKPNKIFPQDGVSPLLDYHENTVVYPSETSCMRLDFHKGTDYLIVLYSLTELNLDSIMSAYNLAMKENSTDIYGAVVKACGKEKIVPAANQTLAKDSINFNAIVPESSRASIMPIVIKIKHE